MSETLPVKVEPMQADVLPPSDHEVFVVARNPTEMRAAHDDLVRWADGRLEDLRRQQAELAENFAIAQKQKWRSQPIKRQLDICRRRIAYYEKVREVIAAGYYVVPNFPVDVIAIRVKRKTATENSQTMERNFDHAPPQQDDQTPDNAPLGEGRYVSNRPQVQTSKHFDKDSAGRQVVTTSSWATGFSDVEFPLAFAKPAIMHATAEAMALRAFDEIGVFVDSDRPGRTSRRGDPMVIGRIRMREQGYGQRMMSFVISWWLDSRTL